MFIQITEAKYLDGYRVEVMFNNGKKGVADFSDNLKGPVFEPLLDLSLFSRLAVDRELGTIVWPNGADVAPEFIYYKAFRDNPELTDQFRKWGYAA